MSIKLNELNKLNQSNQSNKIHNEILNNIYHDKIYLLNKINSMGILPHLPDELISYIFDFLVSITDYIDYYIEKMYKMSLYNFDLEILPYILQLHNNPIKEEICKNWDYGEEFLLISKRHEDGKSFYSAWNNWSKSFLSDFHSQIKCISKPRNKIDDKKLLEYVMPINKILRIDYHCGMYGSPIKCEIDLGIYFQKIIDATFEKKAEIFSIWNDSYTKSFRLSLIDHSNGKKQYFNHSPETTLMCSFLTSFMMYEYH